MVLEILSLTKIAGYAKIKKWLPSKDQIYDTAWKHFCCCYSNFYMFAIVSSFGLATVSFLHASIFFFF